MQLRIDNREGNPKEHIDINLDQFIIDLAQIAKEGKKETLNSLIDSALNKQIQNSSNPRSVYSFIFRQSL